jgi:hypothetical protein
MPVRGKIREPIKMRQSKTDRRSRLGFSSVNISLDLSTKDIKGLGYGEAKWLELLPKAINSQAKHIFTRIPLRRMKG